MLTRALCCQILHYCRVLIIFPIPGVQGDPVYTVTPQLLNAATRYGQKHTASENGILEVGIIAGAVKSRMCLFFAARRGKVKYLDGVSLWLCHQRLIGPGWVCSATR